jgi:hypothetical protein
VVRALWEHTRAVGLGRLAVPILTADQLAAVLRPDHDGCIRLDYVAGRPLKVTLDTRQRRLLRTDLYDRDAGVGTAARVLAELHRLWLPPVHRDTS